MFNLDARATTTTTTAFLRDVISGARAVMTAVRPWNLVLETTTVKPYYSYNFFSIFFIFFFFYSLSEPRGHGTLTGGRPTKSFCIHKIHIILLRPAIRGVYYYCYFTRPGRAVKIETGRLPVSVSTGSPTPLFIPSKFINIIRVKNWIIIKNRKKK